MKPMAIVLTILGALAVGAAVLAVPVPTTGYHAWVEGDEARFNFYEMAKIRGPFKVYTVQGYHVVPPEAIYQSWPQGGKYASIRFPLSLVGGMTEFDFRAVTVTAEKEWPLVEGHFPLPPPKGRGK